MKKIIFTLLFAFMSALTIVSCTEEEIAPNTENGGTVSSDTVVRK